MVEYSLIERNRIANNMFGGADFEIRSYSNVVGATGTGGAEITAAGYAPITVQNNTTNFPAATNGTRANAVAFQKTFTETASIASIAIFAAGGDFLARKVFDEPLEIGADQSWRFPVGAITFTPLNQV